MSLKKRMFRSNMLFLLYALFALFCVTAAVTMIFKGQFSREFESLENAGLDVNVLEAANLIDQGFGGETVYEMVSPSASAPSPDYSSLAEDLNALNYELLVARDGKILYGDHQSEGEELLRDFPLEHHQSGKTEIFYLQKMSVIGKYDAASGSYALAVGGTEEDWWIGPIRQTSSIIIYVLAAVAAGSAAIFLLLSAFFTRRMVKKITDPLEELEKGAKRIREGNLEEPIQYRGDEEFEQICQTFNEMQTSILAAREQRKKDEQARTDMVTGISHDLRTPLTSIQGYIKGILDGVAGTVEKKRQYLETAYESTREMNVLLQKLFDFSRMESGHMPFHVVRGDLAELVEGWIAQKEGEPDGNREVFSFSKEMEAMPEILMDIDQIRRILENLLENSLKYAGKSPVRICVQVCTSRRDVMLEWKDNGAGVPEEKLPHIFERFYRCDEARTTKGSGVGLYVVKWIAEQHGGKVTAANEGGLAIRLYFPMGE